MLYDPGPLRLFTAEEFPQLGPRPRFEAIAAEEIRVLEGGAGALSLAFGEMVEGTRGSHLDGAGSVIGALAEELDRQSRSLDPSIAAVAASVDALEGDLAGLTTEITSDLYTPIPGEPSIPPEPPPYSPYPPGGGYPVPPPGYPGGPSLPPPQTPAPAPPPSELERNPGERGHVARRLQEAAAARGRAFDPSWVDVVMRAAIARGDPTSNIDADINDFIAAVLGG